MGRYRAFQCFRLFEQDNEWCTLTLRQIMDTDESRREKERKENFMVHVSEKAEEVLKEYFKGKEISPIRIYLQSGG